MDSLPPSRYGGFIVSARGAGDLTRAQAASRRFRAPSRGVRFDASAPDVVRAEMEAVLAGSRDDAVLTNATAARHWELPLPAWVALAPDPRTVVAVTPGSAHPDRRGVRGRRLLLPPDHVVEHRGLRVTTVARTWLDCAADIPVEHLVAMGDAALRRELTELAELAAMVRWGWGRRGVVAARRALPILDPAAESAQESTTRALLVLGGVPAPRCNVDIHWQGRWIARVDMCWPEARLIVEYDGMVHLDESQRRRDAQRISELQEAGWLVIVLTADDLRRPERLVARVRALLASRTR
jgi:hypothetical protein